MMTAGQFLLHLYHRPVARLRACLREGGPLAQRRTEQGRRSMESAASRMPPLPTPRDDALTVHLLTGRRFWYQTAFCLASLARSCPGGVRAELYDDGSCDSEVAARLLRLGPAVTLHGAAELGARLDERLPATRFPALRDRWQHYPNIRKLIDPHLAGGGWKLAIDSDLLFFREPTAVLTWWRRPAGLLHAVDCAESYGYSRSLMEQLAGAAIPPLVNVGLCGLRSDQLDWDELEAWTAELIRRERTNYYLEQALVAMLAARDAGRCVLPAGDYITWPQRSEVETPHAVMHHYVSAAKRWYFTLGWSHFAAA